MEFYIRYIGRDRIEHKILSMGFKKLKNSSEKICYKINTTSSNGKNKYSPLNKNFEFTFDRSFIKGLNYLSYQLENLALQFGMIYQVDNLYFLDAEDSKKLLEDFHCFQIRKLINSSSLIE